MKEYFALLGFKARDAVTGFEGIVESISFDLYGCIQAVVRPVMDKKKPGELGEARWFDLKRLIATSKAPVMAVATFEPESVAGGTSKPAFPSMPSR